MSAIEYEYQNLSSYFRLPRWVDTTPLPYKKLRLYVGWKYGTITLLGSLFFVLVIPLWNAIVLHSSISHGKFDKITNNRIFHRLIKHSQTAKIILFWSIFSCVLNYVDTYGDLLFITKRLGRTSTACLPALLFITLRPSPLPKVLYLSLLPIHKWISRIVVLEGILHTVLYLVYFEHMNTRKKSLKLENIYGFVVLFAFLAIAVTSLPKLRRKAFKLFYVTHYIMTWLSIIALHYHARPGIGLYTILNISILTFQIAYRISTTIKTKISVSQISPTLALVEFPLSSLKIKSQLPGAHIRINNKNTFVKNLFYSIIPLAHPFTIASLPNETNVKLIVRLGNFPLKSRADYYVTGAYEAHLDFMKQQTHFSRLFKKPSIHNQNMLSITSPLKYSIEADRVLIVVGGSGISFAIPLLRTLNYNGVSCRLLWVCKDIKDLNLLNHFPGLQGIECYITGDIKEDDITIDYYEDTSQNNLLQKVADYGSTSNEDEIDFTTVGRSYKEAHKKDLNNPKSLSTKSSSDYSFLDHENVNINIAGTCDYIRSPRSTESIGIMSPEVVDPEAFKTIKIPKTANIYYGRPNLNAGHYEWCIQRQCVGPSFTRNGESVCCRDSNQEHHHIDKSRVWVVAAGPTGLVNHAREWATDGGLRCHVESFAL